MIKVDGSLVIQIVNFVFLICILNIVLFKPIRKVLLQRREKVAGFEKSIKTYLRDAKEKDESLISGIQMARKKGLMELESILQTAEADEENTIQRITEKVQNELKAFQDKIAKDTEDIRVSLEKEIDEYAEAIGQKILGRTVS